MNAYIINHLVTLKSLLELGETELSHIAASRLKNEDPEKSIQTILTALQEHRYADALLLIDKILADGTRVAHWTDPEIPLMEAELERVTSDLADRESEQVELEQLIARFQAAHNEVLGERIRKILVLRLKLLEKQKQLYPEKRSAYEKARQDFHEFEQDRAIHEKTPVRDNTELNENEKKELKSLFRKGSKKCHPDLVPAEHREAASNMFRELRNVFDSGDLYRLRHLVNRLESGIFNATDDSRDSQHQKKERIKSKIDDIRKALEKIKAQIDRIKSSNAYLTITEYVDWSVMFEKQAIVLDQEITNLTNFLEDAYAI